MNKYTITPENLSDMFCHACAAVVILEPLIEHKKKSSNKWKAASNKYFMAHMQLSVDCQTEHMAIGMEVAKLKDIYKTCEQLMRSMNYIPEGNIEIPLDHAIEIVYYSKQYEYMRNLYNVVACNRNGKKS